MELYVIVLEFLLGFFWLMLSAYWEYFQSRFQHISNEFSFFFCVCHLNVHYLCTLFFYSSVSQKLSMFLTKDSAIELKQRGILCQMEDFSVSNVCWTVSKINMVTHNNYNEVHFFSTKFHKTLQMSYKSHRICYKMNYIFCPYNVTSMTCFQRWPFGIIWLIGALFSCL